MFDHNMLIKVSFLRIRIECVVARQLGRKWLWRHFTISTYCAARRLDVVPSTQQTFVYVYCVTGYKYRIVQQLSVASPLYNIA